ncbi:uncharacterized protein LOC126738412 [Anthonomus grandis grandis]|uniref:uncharacterized protein LOC126738412 n=1 Tax=Anthonomus grandis grandis TaxID=2921223 RepID=UPI00216579E0|nr:uncharacterized protein LOC126738412 [Anthonomus grandis grandis]
MARVPIVLASFCLIGFGFAFPASNEQLDKATVNDVAVNVVSMDVQEQKLTTIPQITQKQSAPPSTIEISGISTGANPAPANPATPQDNGGFKTQRPGSMFARIIDDIFQIPITVLQNVARLITNPFTPKKEIAAVS